MLKPRQEANPDSLLFNPADLHYLANRLSLNTTIPGLVSVGAYGCCTGAYTLHVHDPENGVDLFGSQILTRTALEMMSYNQFTGQEAIEASLNGIEANANAAYNEALSYGLNES